MKKAGEFGNPGDYVVDGHGNLIGVVHYSVHYRATTNNETVYNEVVKSLPWRDTREEAQADLDAVAQKHGWQHYEEGQ